MKYVDTIIKTSKGRSISAFIALLVLIAGILASQQDFSRSAAAVLPEGPQEPVATVATPAEQPATEAKVAPTEKAETAAATTKAGAERGREIGSGRASFYGQKFAGRRTANGETFNPSEMTAAHKTLPFGSRVRVTNRNNGRSIVVRINDRGPFVAGRVIDVSTRAAEQLGMISSGTAPVKLELIS